MFFFFNDTATTEIYTLSLHDALPIYGLKALATYSTGSFDQRTMSIFSPFSSSTMRCTRCPFGPTQEPTGSTSDRKSTRLNSSHANISYAVFCLKKKKKNKQHSILI